MFINHTHKFIFIHIPKNAGTSIRNSFDRKGYDKRVVSKRYPHDSCSIIKSYCGDDVWNTFFKFAIVRNPYDRMVSYYHFHNSPQYKYPATAQKMSFEEWLNCGLDSNLKKTQSDYLNEDIDLIGRYESLQDSFDIFCDKINIPTYQLPLWNLSRHEVWQNYYDDETLELVYNIFQEDFIKFNYQGP